MLMAPFVHGARAREAFLRRSAPSFQLQSPVPTSGEGVETGLPAAAAAAAEEGPTADTGVAVEEE